MKKILILLFLLVSVKSHVTAQTEGEDIIELKNGRVHKGIVIEQRPGELIRLLQLPSGDTLTISSKEIASMRKIVQIDAETNTNVIDTLSNTDSIEFAQESKYNQEKIHVGLSYSIGGGDWSSQALGIDLKYGLRNRLDIGLGIAFRGGLSNFNNPIYYTFPLTTMASYELKDFWGNRGALVYNAELGYHFMEGNYLVGNQYAELQNGLYLSTGLGLRINILREMGLIFSVGYQLIKTRAELNGSIINRFNYSSGILTCTFFF